MFMKFKVLTYQIDVVVFSTHNSLLLNRQDFSAVDSAMFYQPDYQGERSLGLDGRPFPTQLFCASVSKRVPAQNLDLREN